MQSADGQGVRVVVVSEVTYGGMVEKFPFKEHVTSFLFTPCFHFSLFTPRVTRGSGATPLSISKT